MTSIASTRAKFLTACLGVAWFSLFTARVSAQTNYYNANGTEYAVIGALPGDQVFPDVAVSATGGFVVWQDNITDGDGWGISARRLDSTLSGTLSTFRVNQQGTGDQERPRVALLKSGGAAFVWQGGPAGNQHIYTRFLDANNTFMTVNDVLVNTFTNHIQFDPAIATLANSNVVVVYGSYNQAGSNTLQDVYGQILSPTGLKVGSEFQVNQFSSFNQRTPAVTATTNGGFVVAWVSEQQRVVPPNLGTNDANDGVSFPTNGIITPSVDIYARQYTSAGSPSASEFRVNTDNNVAANPSVAGAADGTFTVAWGAKNTTILGNSWDIYARSFTGAGTGGLVVTVNTQLAGDQYVPHVSSLGVDYLVTWTSLGQDGSREGVYAQFMRTGGALIGGEFRVNTTTGGSQMHPAVASDGVQQFILVWTSYTGSPNTFDLYAQRYANAVAVLQPMSAPFVYAPFVVSNGVYQPQLVVSWPYLLGISVSNYQVYVDGAVTPTALTTSNQWTMKAVNGLSTNSTHTFIVGYVTTDRRQSPLSPSASGTTWSGLNWGGIPYEWMAAYFGGYSGGHYTTTFWPQYGTVLGPNLTLQQVFVSGGNPLDPSTWLRQQLTRTAQGLFLSWNTQPGATYQLQVSTNFATWSNVGSPRYAAGTTDSIFVGGSSAGYYRVAILR